MQTTSSNVTTNSDSHSDSQNEEKRQLQIKINKYKKKKEKLQEYRNRYDVDLDLYKKFKKMSEDETFQIPDMFLNKYNYMTELEKEDKLTLDEFVNFYKNEKITTSHEAMFYAGDNRNVENFSNSSDDSSENNNSDNNIN